MCTAGWGLWVQDLGDCRGWLGPEDRGLASKSPGGGTERPGTHRSGLRVGLTGPEVVGDTAQEGMR